MKRHFVCIDMDTVGRFENDEISSIELEEAVHVRSASDESGFPHHHRAEIRFSKEEAAFLFKHPDEKLFNSILTKVAQAAFELRHGL